VTFRPVDVDVMTLTTVTFSQSHRSVFQHGLDDDIVLSHLTIVIATSHVRDLLYMLLTKSVALRLLITSWTCRTIDKTSNLLVLDSEFLCPCPMLLCKEQRVGFGHCLLYSAAIMETFGIPWN